MSVVPYPSVCCGHCKYVEKRIPDRFARCSWVDMTVTPMWLVDIHANVILNLHGEGCPAFERKNKLRSGEVFMGDDNQDPNPDED